MDATKARWWRPRPPSVLDVALGVVLAAQLIELGPRLGIVGIGVVLLTVMATAVLLARRHAPLLSTLTCLGAHAALVQLTPHGAATTFLALLVGMAVIGARPTAVAVTGLAGGLGIAVEGAWLDRLGGGLADFALTAAVLAGAWPAGLLVARRDRAANAATRRAEHAELVRSTAARDAVARERARVTRELHDVVAHGLTVLVVQTVAAQEDITHGTPAAGVLPRLRAAEDVARECLAELRMLLGVLAPGGDDDVVPVTGGLPGIEDLIARLRPAGLDAELEVTGEPRPLDPGIGLAAYRMVQEGLTNAIKHADGRAAVHLSFDPDGLGVEITTTGRSGSDAVPGAARGLAGLHERAALFGGTFDAGPTATGFRLRARLPA